NGHVPSSRRAASVAAGWDSLQQNRLWLSRHLPRARREPYSTLRSHNGTRKPLPQRRFRAPPRTEKFRTSSRFGTIPVRRADSRFLRIAGQERDGRDRRDGTDHAPQHELENQRPQQPAEADRDVKQPDQAEKAPSREEPGADPDEQAALTINAVDLFLDAG